MATRMTTREEELQKKREEAERKARRGEIDPTHEFTIQVRKAVSMKPPYDQKKWARSFDKYLCLNRS